ncbi:MAG: hypothetical protein EAZ19_17550 [Oscillatoriales cyanobacterium]|nr:MAG: hypothetical protein EAZ39_25155 [Oscillatoriales cyanobacterium]TAG42160.1 MAG: hypothetical protein EAZ33_15835 [Oscillatoriales cyanobacterium]TAG56981.1 MAG: hypothetical protein EAZ28_18770 [Oscillatoriales cyanobacterium]TAG92746.1 MAG: hypothetical protein EAZ19_17550 [Oscillatoriales cyanobacterium]
MIAILAIEITAIGNRGYTDKTRLRGLKTFLVRGGGHRLYSRGFQPPGFLPKYRCYSKIVRMTV